MQSQIVWKPSNKFITNSNLYKFYDYIGFSNKNYSDLHAWSLQNKGEFWGAVWDFTKVIGDKGNSNLDLSSRNLRNVHLVSSKNASTYDLIDCEVLMIDQDSVSMLSESLKD